MTLLEIQAQIPNSANPIVKVIHKNEHFKVLALGFKKGVALKEHKSPLPAKLTVLEGSVRYKESETTLVLEKFHARDIPVNAIHSVEALEDSICLLTQG
ncbi:MAG: hypothetical protein M3Y08_14045 [Fibrobacterota bacterium]|nr:hypothetical protein [Fibrobacterota bacterium]